MSDVMLLGILRMPLPDHPARINAFEWPQIRDTMSQAADRIQGDADLIERQWEALRLAREYIEEDAREECGPKWRDDVLVAIDAVLKEDGE